MKTSTIQLLQQGIKAHKLGNLKEAESFYRDILKTEPVHPDANHNLGVIMVSSYNFLLALPLFKTAIKSNPNIQQYWISYANALTNLKQFEDAEASYKKIIELNPNNFEAYNNLGSVLLKLTKVKESEEIIKKAISLNPDYAEAYSNLGATQEALNRLKDSEESFKKAIKLKPNFATAYFNLGSIFLKLNKLKDSEENLKKAINLKPDFILAHYNLGVVLLNLGRLEEAELSCQKLIALKPDYAEVYKNLGEVQKLLGKSSDSLVSYNHAYTLEPNIDFLLGNLLHLKMSLCIWDDFEKTINKLKKKIKDNKKISMPFPILSLIDDPDIQKKTAKIYTNHKFPKSDILPKISCYQGHKKIKVGYFSADFRNHAIGYLTAELYELHDKSKFEIHAFSLGESKKDEFNNRIRLGVEHFHDVQKMSDESIALLARSLEIDIAIDLAGFTGGNRQGIFAMTLAPIQACYLGYAGTMGSDYMDYLIADHTLIPKDKQQYYSEKIVYLPNSYMVNASKVEISKKLFSRKDFGLPNNQFVFCCFNNHYKINPEIYSRWMKILSLTNESVLWLSDANNENINNLKKEAKKYNINPNRLIFAPRLSLREDHMRRIQLADLFIDTLPYNAHSTASDALSVGLPVLTCIGKSFASRVSASLLNGVNLPELITKTKDQYVATAIELATHPEKFKIIKNKLSNNLTEGTLFDTSLFTKNLEKAYFVMHERSQKGLSVEAIEVDN
ncbi:tetratricopeptide repeat protein [Candidatus Pelagibacter sp.]|nr:tetratricopeptide repeat protein [Candidatus Pelagibacter sp.]